METKNQINSGKPLFKKTSKLNINPIIDNSDYDNANEFCRDYPEGDPGEDYLKISEYFDALKEYEGLTEDLVLPYKGLASGITYTHDYDFFRKDDKDKLQESIVPAQEPWFFWNYRSIYGSNGVASRAAFSSPNEPIPFVIIYNRWDESIWNFDDLVVSCSYENYNALDNSYTNDISFTSDIATNNVESEDLSKYLKKINDTSYQSINSKSNKHGYWDYSYNYFGTVLLTQQGTGKQLIAYLYQHTYSCGISLTNNMIMNGDMFIDNPDGAFSTGITYIPSDFKITTTFNIPIQDLVNSNETFDIILFSIEPSTSKTVYGQIPVIASHFKRVKKNGEYRNVFDIYYHYYYESNDLHNDYGAHITTDLDYYSTVTDIALESEHENFLKEFDALINEEYSGMYQEYIKGTIVIYPAMTTNGYKLLMNFYCNGTQCNLLFPLKTNTFEVFTNENIILDTFYCGNNGNEIKFTYSKFLVVSTLEFPFKFITWIDALEKRVMCANYNFFSGTFGNELIAGSCYPPADHLNQV